MLSTWKMRLVGLVLLPVGALLTVGNWHSVQSGANIWKLGAFVFPMLFFVGLLTLLVPVDKEALFARHGVYAPKTMAHYTLAQKGIVFVGVALSVVNYAAVEAMARGLL